MYAVEFDLRAHPGPHIVVGFVSRAEAAGWAVRDTAGGDASWNVVQVECADDSPYSPSDKAVEEGALAYVRWINPPHSARQPTEQDRHRVRAVLAAAVPVELAARGLTGGP